MFVKVRRNGGLQVCLFFTSRGMLGRGWGGPACLRLRWRWPALAQLTVLEMRDSTSWSQESSKRELIRSPVSCCSKNLKGSSGDSGGFGLRPWAIHAIRGSPSLGRPYKQLRQATFQKRLESWSLPFDAQRLELCSFLFFKQVESKYLSASC
jgi:hypothetical protein